MAYAFRNELGRQDRLPGSRRPSYEYAIALAHAPAQHLVQLGNAEAKPSIAGRISLACCQPKSTREGLYPRIGYAERVQPRNGILTAQFYDLQLPHN